MEYLAHSASLHSNEKSAPPKPGIKHLAPWWPQIEIVNHFRPFIVAGVGLLLVFYVAMQSRRAAVGAGLLLAGNLVLLALLLYQAPHASEGEVKLRIATLNTWIREEQADRIAKFIESSRAVIVLLQEVGRTDRTLLLDRPIAGIARCPAIPKTLQAGGPLQLRGQHSAEVAPVTSSCERNGVRTVCDGRSGRRASGRLETGGDPTLLIDRQRCEIRSAEATFSFHGA